MGALFDNARVAASRWKKSYHSLFVVSDGADWVLQQEAIALARITGDLGILSCVIQPPRLTAPQCFHFTSQFTFSNSRYRNMSRRMSVDFFHGSSGTNPHFQESLDAIRDFHGDVLRIRVSNSRVHDWLLAEGVPTERIRCIPIGIRSDLFVRTSPALRDAARKRLGIPRDAFIIGSFQKDGVGWGEGMEPKLIKGPDLLVQALAKAYAHIPNLHVLLSGPARGYVKKGLEQANIPYHHTYVRRYEDVTLLYHSLDGYLISARDEGGPKGFLESLASGIPCISTRVGQVEDLAQDNTTALLAPNGDAEALSNCLVRLYQMRQDDRERLITAGGELARQHTYEAQQPLWRDFFTGYVIR